MAVAKHRHEPDDGAATEHHPLGAARQACSGCQPGFGALSRVAERVCVQSPQSFLSVLPHIHCRACLQTRRPSLVFIATPRAAHPPTHPPTHPLTRRPPFLPLTALRPPTSSHRPLAPLAAATTATPTATAAPAHTRATRGRCSSVASSVCYSVSSLRLSRRGLWSVALFRVGLNPQHVALPS